MTAQLSFPASPSIASGYLRALVDRRPRRLPASTGAFSIEAELGVVQAEPGRLAAYRDVCELPDDGHLPLTYPHVMAGGIHMAMLLHQNFPVRMAGLVHLANDIELFTPLPADARLALDCRLDNGPTTGRGDEFRLVTEALWNERLAWRETMCFLAPGPRKGRGTAIDRPRLPPLVGEWPVPAGTGRRYARVSGDWNPIHLGAPLARQFGFPAAIAHGMWTVARCLGWLADAPPQAGARLDVRFLKPLLLPGNVSLHAGPVEGAFEREFWLVSGSRSSPHLKGRWTPGIS